MKNVAELSKRGMLVSASKWIVGVDIEVQIVYIESLVFCIGGCVNRLSPSAKGTFWRVREGLDIQDHPQATCRSCI